MSEERKTKVEIDPLTGEIQEIVEESEEQIAEKQLWGKNPARAQAMRDLMFDALSEHIQGQNVPDDKKWEMMFIMAVNSALDLILDSTTTDVAMETSYCFDNLIGMALANKKWEVDIMKEARKAMETVDASKFDNDEDYIKELQAFEEHWWEMGQPALGMRSPNDAIYEMLGKYGLNSE